MVETMYSYTAIFARRKFHHSNQNGGDAFVWGESEMQHTKRPVQVGYKYDWSIYLGSLIKYTSYRDL